MARSDVARIDFNCDLGEGCGCDADIVPLISSASIACGLHAGDAGTMRATVELCLRHGVAIGAHPSFDDREGFGRRELATTAEEVRALVTRQIETLAAVAAACGGRLSHVKPHGALYNRATRDVATADAIADAVARFDASLQIYGLAGSRLTESAERHGLRAVHEVFAERRYRADGTLTARSEPGAVIDSLDDALEQVRGMVREGIVRSAGGEPVAVRADTLCLHGDRPDAVAFARALRGCLEAEGIDIRRVAP